MFQGMISHPVAAFASLKLSPRRKARRMRENSAKALGEVIVDRRMIGSTFPTDGCGRLSDESADHGLFVNSYLVAPESTSLPNHAPTELPSRTITCQLLTQPFNLPSPSLNGRSLHTTTVLPRGSACFSLMSSILVSLV